MRLQAFRGHQYHLHSTSTVCLCQSKPLDWSNTKHSLICRFLSVAIPPGFPKPLGDCILNACHTESPQWTSQTLRQPVFSGLSLRRVVPDLDRSLLKHLQRKHMMLEAAAPAHRAVSAPASMHLLPPCQSDAGLVPGIPSGTVCSL